MKVCRALRTSVGTPYGRAEINDVKELPDELAAILVEKGMFEFIVFTEPAVYVAEVEDIEKLTRISVSKDGMKKTSVKFPRKKSK